MSANTQANNKILIHNIVVLKAELANLKRRYGELEEELARTKKQLTEAQQAETVTIGSASGLGAPSNVHGALPTPHDFGDLEELGQYGSNGQSTGLGSTLVNPRR